MCKNNYKADTLLMSPLWHITAIMYEAFIACQYFTSRHESSQQS